MVDLCLVLCDELDIDRDSRFVSAGFLQLCTLLKQQGYNVTATCRSTTDALQSAGVKVITGIA